MSIQATHSALAVPIAQGGPITNSTLAAILPAARRAPFDMSTELGEFMLQNFAPIVEELLARRRAMDLICRVSTPGNVVEIFPGASS
ncbi:MAG: hypothetical protein KDK11_14745 [Maritimibacter sp.]|nr:hypothetical protein [Maritimibacter sp.]